MLIPIKLPDFLPDFAAGVVRTVAVKPPAVIAPGQPLLDFSIDLSAGQSYDCPPEAHYRLILGERGAVETLAVVEAEEISPGTVLGYLRIDGDGGAAAGRIAKVSAASIILEEDWWDSLE